MSYHRTSDSTPPGGPSDISPSPIKIFLFARHDCLACQDIIYPISHGPRAASIAAFEVLLYSMRIPLVQEQAPPLGLQ